MISGEGRGFRWGARWALDSLDGPCLAVLHANVEQPASGRQGDYGNSNSLT